MALWNVLSVNCCFICTGMVERVRGREVGI